MYAIRSCIADKAKTIDTERFEQLEILVNATNNMMNKITKEVKSLYNTMITNFNQCS